MALPALVEVACMSAILDTLNIQLKIPLAQKDTSALHFQGSIVTDSSTCNQPQKLVVLVLGLAFDLHYHQ
jgi:hypothetical protein